MPQILTASQIQEPDDRARELARRRERVIQRAVMAMLLGLGELFSTSSIRALISRWNLRGVADALNGPDVQGLVTTAYQPIADTFDQAARQAANDDFKGLIAYDPLLAASVQTALREALRTALIGQARDVVQNALMDGIRRGDPVELIADRIREVVSLTPRQAQAVTNFRRLLERGDAGALRRALRDQKFDRRVLQALRGGAPLSRDEIDQMVTRYAERSVAARAATIARTESMQASVSGIRNAYKQAVDSGRLLDREVRRFWLTAQDELVCLICAAIPLLNPDGVEVDESYLTPAGPLDAPLAHPNCRCSERYVADLTRLHNQPFALAA